MPTGTIRSSLVPILQAIAGQLVNYGVLSDASRAIITIQPDFPHFGAEHDILIRPGNFIINRAMNAAAGRVATECIRTVTTVCRTRLNLDEAGRDKVWLTDAAKGHIVFEEFTVDALEEFWPADANNNLLLNEPMRLIRMDGLRKDTTQPQWGQSALDWEIKYLLPLNQAVQ